jgi:malic enzyme
VAEEIALAVAMEGQRSGLAPKQSEDELRNRIHQIHWNPEYPVYA